MNLGRILLGMVLLILQVGCAQRTVQRSAPPTAVATVMRRQVINAADAGDGDPIANRLRQRIVAEPSNPAWRLELASHYGKVGLPDLELEHLRLAAERFPNSQAAHLALAHTLRRAGYSRQAADALERFTAANPNAADVEVLNHLGIAHDEAGNWKAGEQAFRRAIELAPAVDYLRNNLGYNLLQQERIPDAIVVLQQALQCNPRSETARNNLGLALARSSGPQMEEALKHFKNVVDAATASSNLAAALMEQGRFEEGRRLLRAALEYNRNHAAALANLKLVSELDGKPADLPASPRVRSRPWPLAVLKWIFVSEPPKPPSETVRVSNGEIQ